MDVGIDLLVVVPGGVENAERFLGRGGVIKIDERLPIDLGGEDGELSAERFRIKGHVWRREDGQGADAREKSR